MLVSKYATAGGQAEVSSGAFRMAKASGPTLTRGAKGGECRDPARYDSSLKAASSFMASPSKLERTTGWPEPPAAWLPSAETTKAEEGKDAAGAFNWGFSRHEGRETPRDFAAGGCRLQAANRNEHGASQHLPSQGDSQGLGAPDLSGGTKVKRGDEAERTRVNGDGCRVSPKGENVDVNYTSHASSKSGVNASFVGLKGVGGDAASGLLAPQKMDKPSGNNSCASAVYADLSLVCPLHAYRFCLRDFDFGGFLGDGAHGCVFVARERRSGFVCVLKCITKAHLVRGGNEALLKKEVELQAHLKHPHICCMYTWFQTSSAIFLVMEYCLKGDLFALLDKTTFGFDERTVAKQLFQITWAIRTCHDKRIAHLDIKPENVLVDHTDKLKLADFGLSAHIGGEHRKRGVSINRGTCGDNVCSFDEKSDIWTIGILGFELFFKFPPFGSQCHIDEETVMQNIRNKHWSERVEQEALRDPRVNEKLLSMSDDFKAFLSACLNKKASLRPTAEALLEFPFLQKNNPEVVNSVHFLQQPRHQQGHKGFNQPAGPWQTPRPTCC
uniref:PEK kinase, putative n=1 Tax=Neospora caninum (strain Liverpool) TaxID=572307 RepID=A0A0F7UFC3_NEOCL|nr:TPA: PEK kinase, putative [Neospora caninum Liverpool]